MKQLFSINKKVGYDIRFRGVYNTENDTVIVVGEKVGSSFMDSICIQNNDLLPLQIIFEKKSQKFEYKLYDNNAPTKLTIKQQKVLFENVKDDNINYIIITREPYQKMLTGLFQVLKSDHKFQTLFDLSDYYNKKPIGTTKKELLEIRNEIGIQGIDENFHKDVLREILNLSLSTMGDTVLRDTHMDLHNQKIMTFINWLTDVNQSGDIDIFVSDIFDLDEIVVKYKFINKEKIEFTNKHQTKLLDSKYAFLQILQDISTHGETTNTSLGIFLEYIIDTLQSEYLFYDILLEKYKLT